MEQIDAVNRHNEETVTAYAKERKNWRCGNNEQLYYYYRGKIDAANAIGEFFRNYDAGMRTLVYDYLKVQYMDLDSVALDLANISFNRAEREGRGRG